MYSETVTRRVERSSTVEVKETEMTQKKKRKACVE